jgi:predicted nucleotidyltransferase
VAARRRHASRVRVFGSVARGEAGPFSDVDLLVDLLAGTSELPWAEIKGMRIVVDHAYHAIDYERVWRTLRDDVPELDRVVRQWVLENRGNEIELPTRERGRQGGRGDDLGLGL